MAPDESAAMDENSCLSMFHRSQGVHQAVPNIRISRGAVGQAAFDLPVRCDTAVSMESRAAQLSNVSTMEMREREILFRIGNETQASTSPYADGAPSIRKEKRCQREKFRHQMDYDQKEHVVAT